MVKLESMLYGTVHSITGIVGVGAITAIYYGINTGNKSYYVLAGVAAVFSTLIETNLYLDRKIDRFEQERDDSMRNVYCITNRIYQKIPKLNKMRKELNEQFERLFKQMDKIDNGSN